jgi:hypothetical protein
MLLALKEVVSRDNRGDTPEELIESCKPFFI